MVDLKPNLIEITVRSGMKRELAFALQAQSNMIDSPMSRTRSGKILDFSASFPSKSRKRRQKIEEDTGIDSRVSISSSDRTNSTVITYFRRFNRSNLKISKEEPVERREEVQEKIESVDRVKEVFAGTPKEDPVERREEFQEKIESVDRVKEEFAGTPKEDPVERREEVQEKIESVDGVKEEFAGAPKEDPVERREEVQEKIESVNGVEVFARTPKKSRLKTSKVGAAKTNAVGTPSTSAPTTVRGLLKTGFLEGLKVKYIMHTKYKGREERLHGVVKGGKILCFCDSCQGLKTVTAYNFELHARSTKKRPSDYIYLENGCTLGDVLQACVDSPLETLELRIQSVIGADCNVGSSNGSHVETLTPGCQSCFASRLSNSKTKKSVEKSGIRKISKSSLPPKSPDGNLGSLSSQKKTNSGRMTKKDLRLHRLVFMDGILPDGTEVSYYARGKRLLEGYIQNSGIFCRCCNSVISPSQFEAHAGCPSRRKPYLNIYTSNGVSLHELSISLSKDKRFATSENDDICRICADGGDLLLCDICPRAFHKECVGLTSVPEGDWYCQYCINSTQKEKCSEKNENAVAAGRIAGVDPIEQIMQRCIRIVKSSPESDLGGCVLCRAHDFCKMGFGPRTVLLCDQCEREFHVGCLKEHDMGDFKELPEGTWFCSPDCGRIHTELQRLATVEAERLTSLEIDTIKMKQKQKGIVPSTGADMAWRLLSGKTATPDTRLLLSKALSLFHECFDPIVDIASGKDLIPAIVYGRDSREQEFGGMFCTVLTVNSCVVSAGILRVMGREVAELPLVATSRESQGQGYFQALFSCIERLLDSLGVKYLVLPAAEEAESIWTQKFGFTKISLDELNAHAKGCRPTIFQGTAMLHKLVSCPPKSEVEMEGHEREEAKPSDLSLSTPSLAVEQ